MIQNPRYIVGGIHQVVEIDDTLRGYCRQRDCYLTVMYRGRCQYCANGHAAIGRIQVKLVSNPVFSMALAVLLRPDIARLRQIIKHLFERHRFLSFDSRGFLRRRFLSLFGSSSSSFGLLYADLRPAPFLHDGLFARLDGC